MILVTGAGGMVGSYLLEAYPVGELYRTDKNTLDVRDYHQVIQAIERIRPKTVIHLAAETNVDRCEKEVEHAYESNLTGTLNVALACQRYGIEMVYLSTAGVFDGKKTEPYTEFDNPWPVNVYAKTKWEGEKIVQTLLSQYYIIRTGWLFGGREKDKKFVGKILSLCSTRDEIQVVDDKVGNPTYAKDLLQTTRRLIESGNYGIYHIVNEGWCSRYEFAQEIIKYQDRAVKLVPVSSAAFPLPAPRPNSEASRNFKLDLLGLNHMKPWREALRDYLGCWAGRT